MFDRFHSFDEIRLNSIDFQYRMFDYVRRDTKVVKTKSFFPFPSDHENYLPVQSRRLDPRDMTLLLTFYNQCCCSGLHVLLNYICTRRSLYFLDTDKTHASSSTFSSSSVPECTSALLEQRQRAGGVTQLLSVLHTVGQSLDNNVQSDQEP